MLKETTTRLIYMQLVFQSLEKQIKSLENQSPFVAVALR